MGKYLDKGGVTYLWRKIKGTFFKAGATNTSSSKLYLVGTTGQTAAENTLRSNSNVYEQGGALTAKSFKSGTSSINSGSNVIAIGFSLIHVDLSIRFNLLLFNL